MSDASPRETPRFRVLVVDDEPVARRYLRDLLDGEPDFEVAGECGDAAAARAWLARERADLVFLDVRMPGEDGMSLARDAGRSSSSPALVFVTAHAGHAVAAFERGALDYLLKPFDRQRLQETLARVRDRLDPGGVRGVARRMGALLERLECEPRWLQKLPVRDGRETQVVPVAEIDWIGSEDNYVRLHVGQRSLLARGSLGGLEARLHPRQFVRIHRTLLVNVERIAAVSSGARGDGLVTLRDGRTLPLSRRYRERLSFLLEP